MGLIVDLRKNTPTFQYAQPNEKSRKDKEPDCAIRALALASGMTWQMAFDLLAGEARYTQTMPNDMRVCTAVYRRLGYAEGTIKVEKGGKRMTATDFAKSHPHGTYILRVAKHLTCVKDGKIHDTWNCGAKCVYKYWVVSE